MLNFDRTLYDIGNQHKSDSAQAAISEFNNRLFASCEIKTIHDCSIGTGGTTFPLAKLGYTVSGSKLNENLLSRVA